MKIRAKTDNVAVIFEIEIGFQMENGVVAELAALVGHTGADVDVIIVGRIESDQLLFGCHLISIRVLVNGRQFDTFRIFRYRKLSKSIPN